MARLLIRAVAVGYGALVLGPGPVHAQFDGHNTKSDIGLISGRQAPPGVLLVPRECGGNQ